jgi:hypothetical protein
MPIFVVSFGISGDGRGISEGFGATGFGLDFAFFGFIFTKSMPQIGQEPGWSLCTFGSIVQE